MSQTGADLFTIDQTAFFPNIVFAACYLGALIMLIVRAASGRARTWLLFPIFGHIALRLTSYVIFLLVAKNIAGVGPFQINAAEQCWLPATTWIAIAHCAATAVYIAKGPYQEGVKFSQLPMSMRAAFIAPHVLLLIGGLAGVYSPGAQAYKTNDGIVVTVVLIDCIGVAYYRFKRHFLKPPAILLFGTALLLLIACGFRLSIASGLPGTVFPTATLTYVFECAMLTIVTYLWVILKIKKILGLGQYANSVMTIPETYEQPSTVTPTLSAYPNSQSTNSYDNQTLASRQTKSLASRQTKW